jgi:hypothetical protein
MTNKIFTVVLTSILAGTLMSSSAFAQQIDPGHPRISQVDQRLQNQSNAEDKGLTNGTLKPGQAARDEKADARVNNQMQRDEAKHHGHITKREQRHLNRELNHNRHRITRQEHHNENK